MKYNIAFPLIAVALLTACGGSGSSSNSTPATPPAVTPQELTGNNLSSAVTIDNAQSTNLNAQIIPAQLETVNASSAERIVVTANSNFRTQLSVPAGDIPVGKKVAGYLVQIEDGDFSFIPATQTAPNNIAVLNRGAISHKVANAKTKKIAYMQPKSKDKLRTSDNSFSSFTMHRAVEADVEGETEINVAGWANQNFILNERLAGLVLRIYPLLVNETVASILSIEDIDLTDESNWIGVQELLMNVEAVATAEIQISLTWNSQTDIDLWVVGPDGEKISYQRKVSPISLGWLDFDNVFAYGPENITFNYQMPLGDYKVYVHHYNGGVKTDYQVTVAIGDSVNVYNGDFPEGVTSSDDINEEGVDEITTIAVDSTLNSQLEAPVLLNQYLGAWKLPESSSISGYVVIEENSIIGYSIEDSECTGYQFYIGSVFPTGFSIIDNKLHISDALLGSQYYYFQAGPVNGPEVEVPVEFENEEVEVEVPSFTYSNLELKTSTLPVNCDSYENFSDQEAEILE